MRMKQQLSNFVFFFDVPMAFTMRKKASFKTIMSQTSEVLIKPVSPKMPMSTGKIEGENKMC